MRAGRGRRHRLCAGAGHGPGSYDVYSCKVGSAVDNYRFRLKVARRAGLPFEGGVSPVVSVAVRS